VVISTDCIGSHAYNYQTIKATMALFPALMVKPPSATGQWFSLGIPVSSINKSYRHDVTEILLKVTLIIIAYFWI
jgi:hypothetical protein